MRNLLLLLLLFLLLRPDDDDVDVLPAVNAVCCLSVCLSVRVSAVHLIKHKYSARGSEVYLLTFRLYSTNGVVRF